VRPSTGDLFVANTDARNLVRFEPNVRGHIVDNRVTRVTLTINGKVRGLLYRPSSNDYVADRTGLGPFTRAELLAKIAAGDTLSLMGVPPGSGVRMGIDRDLDGRLDGD
jgi:hypothetical protein